MNGVLREYPNYRNRVENKVPNAEDINRNGNQENLVVMVADAHGLNMNAGAARCKLKIQGKSTSGLACICRGNSDLRV